MAIELATSRLRLLSLSEIDARLDNRFRLLTGGRRTALPRQQTLKALIDWSWNLLNEEEQALLRRLSIFVGGWTLDAAEAVAAEASLDVLENLTQLVNKSLVIVENLATGAVRYRMLESIQEYARERLIESGEWERLEEQHAHYHREGAELTAEKLRGPDMVPWLGRIRLEVDNIRKMLAWLLENNPDGALALTAHLFHSRVYWTSPGEARAYDLADRRVALFNEGGRFYAIDDTCPHQGASLSTGSLHAGRVICPPSLVDCKIASRISSEGSSSNSA